LVLKNLGNSEQLYSINKFLNQLGSEPALAREVNEIRLKKQAIKQLNLVANNDASLVWLDLFT
jgi:hypothetical protein